MNDEEAGSLSSVIVINSLSEVFIGEEQLSASLSSNTASVEL